jgi:hypothetical protein
VIASVPSDVALCSYPGCRGPAWTLNGRPLPFTRQFDDPEPTDNPAAVIPVGRIVGPILLDCGGDDLVWKSCAYADAIVAELTKAKDPWVHEMLAYPDAGHVVGALVPYEPYVPQPETAGVHPLANQLADASLWPKILAFLSSDKEHA